MKNYIVYNKKTGDILRTGCCPSSMLSIQANEEDAEVIEGIARDNEHKIVNKKPVKIKEIKGE